MTASQQRPTRVAFFSPQLNPVGTEAVLLSLARGFVQRGYDVDLLRAYREWDPAQVGQGMRIVGLGGRVLPMLPRYGWWFRLSMAAILSVTLPGLVAYLRREKPDVLIAGLAPASPLVASKLSRSPTRVVVTVQGWPSHTRLRQLVWRGLYPFADAVVAPSSGVAEETARIARTDTGAVPVVPNPVLDESVDARCREPLEHPWFQGHERPVVLGAGRLTRQKDFDTLIKAFKLVRQDVPARLVILGEGERRATLESLVRKLGLGDDVDLPGHVDNPYKYMARADVFALSSRWEGPGHVLIEALATGAPVVSTDCPSGPREILVDGRAGRLTPVGDEYAMSSAILDVLRRPDEARRRAEFGRSTTRQYYAQSVVDEYVKLITSTGHVSEANLPNATSGGHYTTRP